MKSKRLILGGLLLIAAALCLMIFNVCEDRLAYKNAKKALQELNTRSASQEAESEPDYIIDPSIEMPTREVEGEAYIGTLELPALKLSLPVINQWSDERLRLAPCRYKGSAYRDDLIIAGHNYSSHFGKLEDLKTGNIVYFTDVDGNRFSYTVSEIDELAGTAVEEIMEGEWDLTLFTCTIDGKARVTVRCKKDL